MISNLVIPIFFLIYSLAAFLIATFAYQLGIDANPSWGISRFILLFFSLILLFLSAYMYSGKLGFIVKSEKIKLAFIIGHIWGIIFILYIWFITFGTFTKWTSTTQYYSLLADAFNKGQFYVDIDPGGILQVEDPYNPDIRPNLEDLPWDMSLYDKKLYLYWGPVPAILITPIQWLFNIQVTDMYLVLFFLCGLLIINSLLLIKIWDSFLKETPPQNVFLGIFIIGLSLPLLWIANKPEIYEAALSAAQFFLMCGIYFIVLAFEKEINSKYLFFAGVFLACAVGSRATSVFSVIFLTGIIFYLIWKQYNKDIDNKYLLIYIISFISPLLISAVLIGYYNWARFNSPFEFGLRYQLTFYNLNRDIQLTFQPDYFFLNFYGYILQPFQWISKFPFIQPTPFINLITEGIIQAPKIYGGTRVIGFIFYSPFLLLALVPLNIKYISYENNSLYKIILYILSGTFFINFATILFYFYSQMRFLVDIISQITLLAVVGYWLLICKYKTSKIIPKALNIIIAFTLITSLLLSFTSEKHRIQRLNPKLMEKINSLFIWE